MEKITYTIYNDSSRTVYMESTNKAVYMLHAQSNFKNGYKASILLNGKHDLILLRDTINYILDKEHQV